MSRGTVMLETLHSMRAVVLRLILANALDYAR